MDRRATTSLKAVAVAMGLAMAARAEEPPMSSTVRATQPNQDGTTATRVAADQFAGEQRHVGDIVSMAPGTSIIDYGGILATAVVSIRGASADEVQVVFDGVPLNANVGGGFDLSLIPAALVDSVEVQRGSDGARDGAGAMGGTVVLAPVARSRALLTYGSFGTFGGSASWASSAKGSPWHFVVAGDARHTNGDFSYHRDPTPELATNDDILTLVRKNNDTTLASLLLRADRDVGAGKISALLLFNGADRGLAGDIFSSTPTSRQTEGNGFADLRWKSGALGDWSFEAPVTVKAGLLQTADAGLGSATGTQRLLDTAVRPAASWSSGAWKLDASGLAGYEGFLGTQFGSHVRLRAALGLQATLALGDWTATAAVRGEQWGPTGAVLPRLGGSYRITKGVTVGANAALGFRPPSFAELYYASGPVIPNPTLRPEHSMSADLGIRLHFGSFSGAVTGFGGQYQDLIIYVLYPGFRAKPQNIGHAGTFGGELELHWKPTGGWWTGFDAMASFGEVVTRNLVPSAEVYGQQLPYRPQHRGVVRLGYRQTSWRAAVDAQATSVAYINESNTRFVPPYVDLHVSAGVRAWGPFWISGEMRNGLDVMDRMNIDGYPLPGRVFLANLSWEPEEEAP